MPPKKNIDGKRKSKNPTKPGQKNLDKVLQQKGAGNDNTSFYSAKSSPTSSFNAKNNSALSKIPSVEGEFFDMDDEHGTPMKAMMRFSNGCRFASNSNTRISNATDLYSVRDINVVISPLTNIPAFIFKINVKAKSLQITLSYKGLDYGSASIKHDRDKLTLDVSKLNFDAENSVEMIMVSLFGLIATMNVRTIEYGLKMLKKQCEEDPMQRSLWDYKDIQNKVNASIRSATEALQRFQVEIEELEMKSYSYGDKVFFNIPKGLNIAYPPSNSNVKTQQEFLNILGNILSPYQY